MLGSQRQKNTDTDKCVHTHTHTHAHTHTAQSSISLEIAYSPSRHCQGLPNISDPQTHGWLQRDWRWWLGGGGGGGRDRLKQKWQCDRHKPLITHAHARAHTHACMHTHTYTVSHNLTHFQWQWFTSLLFSLPVASIGVLTDTFNSTTTLL